MSRPYIVILVALLIIGLGFLAYSSRKNEELRVFNAGSLENLVEDVAEMMKDRYSIIVLNEPSGSVDVIRKVVDLGKRADLVMVADHRLIEQMMMPEHARWAMVFASNEMVLAYTNSSKYHSEIKGENWYEIIRRPDVKVGMADPNRDPCGYRSLMVLGLTYLYTGDSGVLEMLEEVGEVDVNGTLLIDVSQGVSYEGDGIIFREKSVDLIALLEAGSLDYAFEYKNVALSHGLEFVELPKESNLSDPALDDLYSRVSVRILGAGNKVLLLKAKAITYGLTVPTTAENVEGAKKFIELLLSEDVLERNGFIPLENPIILGDAPRWLIEAG